MKSSIRPDKWQKQQDLKSVRVKTLREFESRHRQSLSSMRAFRWEEMEEILAKIK